jgi:hypothetical protein
MPPHPTVSPTASAMLGCASSTRPEANCNWSHYISGYWLNPNNNTWTYMWGDNAANLLGNELCGSPAQGSNCSHGPFTIVYYGSWQVKHWWQGMSGDAVNITYNTVSQVANLSC